MDVEDSTLTEQQYADMKVGLSALWATATGACQPCPQAPEALFWSSTLVDEGGREACNVYFGTGSQGTNDRDNAYSVRLVRSIA